MNAAAPGPLPEPAEFARQRLSPWFGVIGLVLMATLLAAAFVQVRQYALLNLTVQDQVDYRVLALQQIETEYLRLREQWHLSADAPQDDPATLQLRYDIFVSRLTLLDIDRSRRLLASGPLADTTLADIDAFVRRADLYLGTEPRGAMSPQAARSLLVELTLLGDPIHRMLLEASHRMAEQLTERGEQVRQHNKVGLALTGFLSAMVLVFALIALRQMRKLENRRRMLQAMADELRDARIEAESANEAKTRFLADMSHELRTPLNGLVGMLALARAAPSDPRSADWLRTAAESADHLLHLLDDILDLSKLEAGTLTLSPQPLAPGELVRDVLTLLQPTASAKGLDIRSEIDPTLPDYLLLDATRMRQVLFNLLSNAIKYSENGPIVLRIHRAPGSDDRDLLAFDVADNGIGMLPATVAKLFRRYGRADDPHAHRQGGTGLGLAISRNIAWLMGGEIVVRSTPGAGSVFSLQCPLLPATQAPEADPGEAAADAAALRVLVAEDHPVNRMYMAALLERLGHHAEMAEDGLQAVQAMREREFDVVLMDVHMPVMDGVAATEAIRRLPPPASLTRIVALTADVFADTRERCLRAGIDEVVTKPISQQALETLFSRSGGGGERRTAPSAVVCVGMLDETTIAGLRELMGPDKARALYDGFFAHAVDAGRRMREAMREADAESVRSAAHAVKSAALNLGLPALADATATLNRDAATMAAAPLALAVQRYEDLAQATRALCAAEGLLSA